MFKFFWAMLDADEHVHTYSKTSVLSSLIKLKTILEYKRIAITSPLQKMFYWLVINMIHYSFIHPSLHSFTHSFTYSLKESMQALIRSMPIPSKQNLCYISCVPIKLWFMLMWMTSDYPASLSLCHSKICIILQMCSA